MTLFRLVAFFVCLLLPTLLPFAGGAGAGMAIAQESPSPQRQDSEGEAPNIDERLEAPEVAGVDPNEYEVGPGDVLAIRVWREPELSQQQAVRPDGKITMPLVGDIGVNGMTPQAIQKQLGESLGEYILNPNVMVLVLQVRSKKFTITGQVGRPGSYPLLAPTTVLDALTNAGGFRDFANTKKITIIRGTERFNFNYKDVIKGKGMEQNIMLEDKDLIVVP
jgi:polysaccharide biosynthesis/export protein